jgi:hypothetical protein
VLPSPIFDEPQLVAHCCRQAGSVVPLHGQTAALLGTIQRKGRNDGQAAHHKPRQKRSTIGFTLVWLRQEVENGAVVPNVKLAGWPPICDFAHFPLDLPCKCAQPSFRRFKCGGGNVEDCDVLPAMLQQFIYEV